MIRGIESILIGSANATKLAKFYKEVVGLKQTMEFEMGDDNQQGFAFEGKGYSIMIIDHSKVKGKNVLPDRIIINFEVDDIKKEVRRLKRAKVKVVKDIYHLEDYGYIATFADIDGNYFHFVQVRG